MQLSLAFPDSGYPDVLFIATEDSLAKDALEAAAEEWLVDPLFLEISYCSDFIPPSCNLLSKGVVADSQLTVSLLRWIGKELLTDDSTREKVGKLFEKGRFGSDQILRLDTPTFVDDDGCLKFSSWWIPDGILSICFANPNPSITSTTRFLVNSNITHVDLLGLQYITSVGDSFLAKNRFLETVDLSCLRNVSSIGDSFLSKCPLLQNVDFCSFERLTCVGYDFMACCSSLKTISNISGLGNVKSIGNSFLGECKSLVSVDLSLFTSVESIESGFLHNCSSLETVDFSSFEKITRIGDHFLSGCSSLKTISNISGLRNVKSIGKAWRSALTYFLFNCDSLAPIDDSVPGYECLSEEMKKEFKFLMYSMGYHRRTGLK